MDKAALGNAMESLLAGLGVSCESKIECKGFTNRSAGVGVNITVLISDIEGEPKGVTWLAGIAEPSNAVWRLRKAPALFKSLSLLRINIHYSFTLLLSLTSSSLLQALQQ